jgi:hypothetical protein
MFRWYRNAARCYVYLTDVLTGNQTDLSPELWKAPFQNSRWFTRSWTLQELIAPPSVEFFCSNGNQLGNKKSLEGQLHEITGIPVSALQGSPLSKFGFEERISWAQFRETKREEDKAYSLLGIFDISIPVIYGEGKENAFRRLNREWKYRLDELSTISQAVSNDNEQSTTFSSLFRGKAAGETRAVDHITDSGYGGSGASKSQSRGKVLWGSPSVALVATIPESQAESQAESTHCETQTVYSDTESLSDPKLVEYVTAFADELYRSLPSGFDKAKFERVLPVLDELLRTFAFKVSCDGSTTEHRNLMYLVHRYRRRV